MDEVRGTAWTNRRPDKNKECQIKRNSEIEIKHMISNIMLLPNSQLEMSWNWSMKVNWYCPLIEFDAV